tara:strand:- start:496 stop:789 length:294 start_codon:yes stop_codon:yes gene_type:complete
MSIIDSSRFWDKNSIKEEAVEWFNNLAMTKNIELHIYNNRIGNVTICGDIIENYSVLLISFSNININENEICATACMSLMNHITPFLIEIVTERIDI